MINFYNQVPTVYNNASRDFQYLSRLINVVLNSVKHNVDDLYELPNNKADPRLAELLAITLGFKVKRNYDQKQLTALVSILPSILKYKGTLTAINLACIALIRASGARGIYQVKPTDNYCLEVLLPDNLIDTVLFTDLLPYILPAGMTVRLVTKTIIDAKTDRVELGYNDFITAKWVEEAIMDTDNGKLTGLSAMFDDSTLRSNVLPEFTNFNTIGDNKILNTGLLNNSIITSAVTAVNDPKTDHLNTPKTVEET